MSMAISNSQVLQSRWLPAMVLAVMASLSLFWLMSGVIGGGGHSAQTIEVMPSIDFVRLRRDTEVQSMERRKPPPPPPPQQPPPPQRMEIATENVQQQAPTPFAVPNLGLSASVSGGPFLGQMGGGGAAPPSGGFFEGDIIPLQRVPPAYPPDARRARITGYVQLEITVNADGTVRAAKVIDAKPKGLFEAAAVSAVYKWKFEPKVVNGQPVEQRGNQKIEFNLNG
jgi:protein TonB